MFNASSLVILLFFISPFYFSGCQNPKEAIIESVIKYGFYEGMYAGASGKISPQWKNYEAMAQEFSEEELAGLCEHQNPVVRCYAFKALTESCSPMAYDVLLQHLSDTVEYDRYYGCFGDFDRVTDNFLDEVGYDKRTPAKFTLSENQYNYIDSILLFRDEIKERSWGSIRYRSRRYMLQRMKPLPEFKKRIREIAESGVYESLPLLAKFKDPADTIIFKALLSNDGFSDNGRTLKNCVRRAVIYFPHPSFYPVLKEQLLAEIGTNAISDYYESFPLYLALVQYPTMETRKLFETALRQSEEEFGQRSAFIFKAIQKYPSKNLENVVKTVPEFYLDIP